MKHLQLNANQTGINISKTMNPSSTYLESANQRHRNLS